MPLLEVTGLTTTIERAELSTCPVNNVSFSIDEGQTLAVVGESGSGKSMLALSMMRLVELEIGATVSGTVNFLGRDLFSLSQREMQQVRGQRIGMIFQEPMTALNPVLTIGRQLLQVGKYHRNPGFARRKWLKERKPKVTGALKSVGIPDPEKALHLYPHQLSGGMRQRVVIAMALLGDPALLIADEPTTALDVTTQAQILELLSEIQRTSGMALILITHDMGVAAEMADKVAVMYAGSFVEEARADSLFASPVHPYTRGLLDSVPPLTGERRPRLRAIPGSVPSLEMLPKGCPFSPRCQHMTEKCETTAPALERLAAGDRVACWHPGLAS